MKVKIEYTDISGLTEKEILSQMHTIFGDTVDVTTAPNNNSPRACIKYAIDKLLTEEQTIAYFDYPGVQYKAKINKKIEEIKTLVDSIIKEIIRDNENKWI